MTTPELRSLPSTEAPPYHPQPSVEATRRGYAIRASGVVAVGLFAWVLAYFSALLPLAQHEIWSHLRYGEWIVTEGRLPEQELFSPFSDPRADHGNVYWLGQVTLYLVFHAGELLAGGDELLGTAGGVQMLRLWHALLMVAKIGLIILALRRVGRSMPLALAGAALVTVWMTYSSDIARPQMFGEVFFAFLLWWVSATHLSRWTWLVIPALFLIWANCHPSFLSGLAFLSLLWTGRMLEFAMSRRLRRNLTFWRSGWLWQGLAALALAVLATCLLNPAGPEIYPQVAGMLLNRNMHTLPEYQSLVFKLGEDGQHLNYLASLIVLVVSQAASPRVLPFGRVLILLVFATVPSFVQGMLPWWMMLVPWLAIVLWRDILAVVQVRIGRLPRSAPSRANLVLAGLLACAALLATGGLPVPVVRDPPSLDSAAAPGTLWRLARQLRDGEGMPELASALHAYPQRSFHGVMLVQCSLADYLMWSLPPRAPLMVYSQAYYFSEDHWQYYIRALGTADAVGKEKPEDKEWPGWRDILDRQTVNLIAIHGDEKLAHAIRRDPAWTVVQDVELSNPGWGQFFFEDVKLFIAVRKNPVMTAPIGTRP